MHLTSIGGWVYDENDIIQEDIVDIAQKSVLATVDWECELSDYYADKYLFGNAGLEVVIYDENDEILFEGDFSFNHLDGKIDDILGDMAKQFRDTGNSVCEFIGDLIEEMVYLIHEEASYYFGCYDLVSDAYLERQSKMAA